MNGFTLPAFEEPGARKKYALLAEYLQALAAGQTLQSALSSLEKRRKVKVEPQVQVAQDDITALQAEVAFFRNLYNTPIPDDPKSLTRQDVQEVLVHVDNVSRIYHRLPEGIETSTLDLFYKPLNSIWTSTQIESDTTRKYLKQHVRMIAKDGSVEFIPNDQGDHFVIDKDWRSLLLEMGLTVFFAISLLYVLKKKRVLYPGLLQLNLESTYKTDGKWKNPKDIVADPLDGSNILSRFASNEFLTSDADAMLLSIARQLENIEDRSDCKTREGMYDMQHVRDTLIAPIKGHVDTRDAADNVRVMCNELDLFSDIPFGYETHYFHTLSLVADMCAEDQYDWYADEIREMWQHPTTQTPGKVFEI